MSDSVSMMISFVRCSLGWRCSPPVAVPERLLSRGRVAARSAKYRGGQLGLCYAPPAIIGARVPEAYGAIMEPIQGYGNRESPPGNLPSVLAFGIRFTRIGAWIMFSSAVMCGNRLKRWNTIPMSLRSG